MTTGIKRFFRFGPTPNKGVVFSELPMFLTATSRKDKEKFMLEVARLARVEQDLISINAKALSKEYVR